MSAPYLDAVPLPTSLDSPLESPSDGLPASKRTNTALTTKLTAVLSTSYADHEIRDTLRLLDARTSDGAPQNGDSLRRNLKANAEREVIDINARIVDDFGAVASQLKRVGALLDSLNSTCQVMKSHILAAKQESRPMLEEVDTLLKRKKETETKEQVLKAFTAHFLVSDEELDVLTSPAAEVDERFFVALDRVKKVHTDCSVLLGYNSSLAAEGTEDPSSSRLGMEVLESTTRTLDSAFKKLYTWIQSRFKTLDIEDPRISGSIRRALRVLSERPSLFQNCLDFFAQARQVTLSEAFQDALTGAAMGSAPGVGNTGKAIEFSTHEPLRYVGDMLAWVHSAGVSEKEALEGLFVGDEEEIAKGMQQGRSAEPWMRVTRVVSTMNDTEEDGEEGEEDAEQVFDGRKALSELISRNLSLVYQTLQSRVDITVRTGGDPVLIFKVFNLLDFYRGIFAKLLGADSKLTKSIQQLQASTLTSFEAALEEETSAAVASMDAEAPQELTPPVFLATALSQFSEVCRARGPQTKDVELERLYTVMLSGMIGACGETAARISDTRQRTTYQINYMTALRSTLANLSAQIAAAQAPLEKAAQELQTLSDRLVDLVATTFHEYSGVAELTQEIDARRSQQHAREQQRKWLVENLDQAAQQLDDFLSSALMDAQEALKPLLDRSLAQRVVAEAVERFCAEFDELEGILESIDVEAVGSGDAETDEDGNEPESVNGPVESLRELYPRTGAEVRALLS
jgi:conserved oligomeric Golgi complex subunit 6